MKNKIIVIIGPTAVGKTKVAVALAKKINGEIISCDSMQVYKGLNVLSAKPTRPEQKKIRHHLIDIIEPSKSFNVNTFIRLSKRSIEAIHKRGVVPILVGGTGLYIDSLLNGLFKGPKEDKRVRQVLYEKAEQHGSSALHKKLEKIDPQAAQKIHPHDIRRIVRALEVFELTGKRISELQTQRKGLLQDKRYAVSIFGVSMPRPKLYERINSRVDLMFEQGAVKEVERLLKKRCSKTFQQALGVKEIREYLAGAISLDEAKERLKKNTRHFAKRQLTWFRKHHTIEWIESGSDVSKASSIKSKVKEGQAL